MVDDELQQVDFTSNNSIYSHILNKKKYNPFEKYPVNNMPLQMRIKSFGPFNSNIS